MIKTAQRRFILITLLILLVVFSVIFGVMWKINGNNFAREIQGALSDIEREYNANGGETPMRFFKKFAVIEVSAYDTATRTGNKNIVYGEDAFSQNTFEELIYTAYSANFSGGEVSGSVGNAYFKLVKNTIYVVDMQDETERFHSSVYKTLILLSVSFFALAIVVYGLSGKVFEPIKHILNKQKQFISDASHELKTPVSIISANADVVRTEDNKAYVDSIKKQVDRLNFLVNDLLTLARLDEGNVKTVKETFNLSDEVMQTVLPFDAVAFEKGKTLNSEIENDLNYEGAKDDVKKILSILLDNAIKYSSTGGEIKVLLKKSGARIILSVYNDGSMIPERDSQKIFERFYRGDASRSRESGGNGLGLSIAKSIATANKWTITADSVYGKSMTITLTL